MSTGAGMPEAIKDVSNAKREVIVRELVPKERSHVSGTVRLDEKAPVRSTGVCAVRIQHFNTE
jgi:hypothetical protein